MDVFIIGGGINGCGIARDLVGRGYSVALAEMNDFASGTSSWSTKLIHGGLRYLEHYEFRLVREALLEREVLWRMAPHIIRPLRFVLPHHGGLRPSWLLRLGLFLYDNIGGRDRLPPTRTLDLTRDEAGAPLKPSFTKGFEYSDCRVDDARLVVLNARDAADRGATLLPRTEVTAMRREGAGWGLTLTDGAGARSEWTARLVVNAAGPWVDRVLKSSFGRADAHNVRLVQGSHIVVKRPFDHDRAYIFQNADARIIFAIPYEDDFVLIGTTDRDFEGDPADATITAEERDYLLQNASAYFRHPIRVEDVVWTFSGVRPLYDDGASKAQEATRDYVLRTDGTAGEAPLLNVFGGKLTTYRKLAEAAVEKVGELIGVKGEAWTEGASLPGGHMPVSAAETLHQHLCETHPFLDPALAKRLARLYGLRAQEILRDAKGLGDLGRHFGADLYESEVAYLMDQEWAMRAEDVVWRRTKLGLRMSEAEVAALDAFMTEAAAAAPDGQTQGETSGAR
ncbi:glycerol-3-phosphate dehydrogenase [Acuticoccus mangrovi]|uniref:glycerol-3-phosphate dehydrogenase n=1 Tax=Acuticoccus mangrovi TaxID=2796142 RepID=UPI002FC771C4